MIIIKTISAKDFSSLSAYGQITILDLRDYNDYIKFHIKSSISIPYKYLSKCLHTLSKNVTYYLLCEKGYYSKQAYYLLSSKGFNCVNVEGGISQVKKYL